MLLDNSLTFGGYHYNAPPAKSMLNSSIASTTNQPKHEVATGNQVGFITLGAVAVAIAICGLGVNAGSLQGDRASGPTDSTYVI